MEFMFLYFHYYYYSFWVYFSFSSCPRIVAKRQIELHSPQIFESGGEVEESEVKLVMGAEIERLAVLVDCDEYWVLMVPITPFACSVEEGLDGSVVVQGAFGIISYNVPYWK